jgi:hypothetical protein
MSRVVASLNAADKVCMLRKYVYEFAFAFVAELCAQNEGCARVS